MSEPVKDDSQMIVTMTVADLRRIVAEEVKAAMGPSGNGEDRLIDAEEAGKLMSVSPEWFYKNWKKLPFSVKVHHKMLRFSHAGIQRYIAAKKSRGRILTSLLVCDTLRIMTGDELRKIRARLKLTQQKFAELIGTTRNTVARWERGELGMRETTARLIRLIASQKTKGRAKK